MEYRKEALTAYNQKFSQACQSLCIPMDDICFFDIETTGLSPKISSLYLIGIVYREAGHWQLVQWFADDYTSEADILLAFANFTARFSVYINYNGSTFDIPYLEKKYNTNHIPSPFLKHKTLDIYRQIRSKKTIFSVSDMKLVTMERLLSFYRQDNYSGKDCIQLYTNFMQNKYAHAVSEMTIQKEKLMLHNKEDLIGTVLCSQLLVYEQYTAQSPNWVCKDNSLYLYDTLPFSAPISLSFENNVSLVTYKHDSITFCVPLYNGTLRHYFDDYKNYYYLPLEDMAVHKSVGIYVDTKHRQKATASNCYIKKEGCFLPLPSGFSPNNTIIFQKEKKQKQKFIVWEEDTFDTFLTDYLSHLFSEKQKVT